MVEAKDVMTQILAAAMAQTLRDRSIVVGLVLQLTLRVDDLMKAFPIRQPPKRRLLYSELYCLQLYETYFDIQMPQLIITVIGLEVIELW